MRIAVVTSGGDAPGMNAALRAVVRAAAERGWETRGVLRGYEGLIAGEWRPLGPRDVGGGLIASGGTVLGSARSERFKTPEGRRGALRSLEAAGAGALVVVGGNGSQQGAAALAREGFPVIGLGSTIDNDLLGAEPSLGVDTALNVAVEAIDRLKTTAASFRRVFIVEVMGRECGYLALMAALAGGAEAVVTPELEVEPARVAAEITGGYGRGKAHGIVVAAEGARCDAGALERHFTEAGFDVRRTVLGHVQRGGRPTVADRVLGTRLGAEAVARLARGERGLLLGAGDGVVRATPLEEVAGRPKPLDPVLLRLAETMAL